MTKFWASKFKRTGLMELKCAKKNTKDRNKAKKPTEQSDAG